jgi:hypothetical protein
LFVGRDLLDGNGRFRLLLELLDGRWERNECPEIVAALKAADPFFERADRPMTIASHDRRMVAVRVEVPKKGWIFSQQYRVGLVVEYVEGRVRFVGGGVMGSPSANGAFVPKEMIDFDRVENA